MRAGLAAITITMILTLAAAFGLRSAHADSTDTLREQRLRERQVAALERIERHLDNLATSRFDESLEAATRQLQECTRALRDNTRALEQRR